MKWYDLVAPVYNKAVGRLYFPYRQKLITSLELKSGQTVLDVGCGSGLNFELIIDSIGPEGTLIGVDFSAKMLNEAQKLITKHEWNNVFLLQQDVTTLERKHIGIVVRNDISIDRVLCTLGLSVFPDWQGVFARSFELLRSEGVFGLMDLYNPNTTFGTRIINFFADSDIARKVWLPLQEVSATYREEHLPLMHGTEVVVIATGSKP
jgi:demethylmenaquinone methyltransferase/2-methoxy-6-polyprenyl-1,4-benzoquinol methylase